LNIFPPLIYIKGFPLTIGKNKDGKEEMRREQVACTLAEGGLHHAAGMPRCHGRQTYSGGTVMGASNIEARVQIQLVYIYINCVCIYTNMYINMYIYTFVYIYVYVGT